MIVVSGKIYGLGKTEPRKGLCCVKKWLMKVITFALCLGICGTGLACWLALQDDNNYKGQALSKSGEEEIIYKLAYTIIGNEQITLSAAEMNSMLRLGINSPGENRSGISTIRVEPMAGSNLVNVYCRFKRGKISFGVTASVSVGVDNVSKKLVITIHKMKVGRLPIPLSVWKRLIKRLLNCEMQIMGNDVYISSVIHLKAYGLNLTVRVSELGVRHGNFFTRLEAKEMFEIRNFLRDKMQLNLPF